MSLMHRTPVPVGLPRKEEPPKPTAFDVLTRLVLPIALVAFAQQQEQPVRFWAFIVLAFLIAVIGFYHIGVKQIRTWADRWHDRRVAKATFPGLRRLVKRFGELIDTTSDDNLEHIARHILCHPNVARFEELRMIPLDLFHGFWQELESRVEEQEPSLGNLVRSASELYSLVNSYNRYGVTHVFERFPNGLRDLLTDEARSALESFRERFVEFLKDYDEGAKDLKESLRTVRLRTYNIKRPKPL